jgi:flagellar basal-body rod modification protein FlgD
MAISGVSGTSSSSITGSRQGIADNFDTFLQLLTTQLKNQNPLEPLDTNAVTYIGKVVTAAGTRSELIGGKAVWNFSLDDAAEAIVSIKDAGGNTVYTEQGSLQAGAGQFEWDGTTSTGTKAPNGTYTLSITGTNVEGRTVPISTEFSGTVTGIDFTGSEPVLLIGTTRVNISGVTSIRTAPTAAET